MSLRLKTVTILIAIIICAIIIAYVTSRYFVRNSFEAMEINKSTQDVEIATDALLEEIKYIGRTSNDWAYWNETYDFIISRDKKYIENNLLDKALQDLKINYMIFINNNKEIIFSKGVALHNTQKYHPIEELKFEIFKDSNLIVHKNLESRIDGLIVFPVGPAMISSRPILNNLGKGPIHGTLIILKFIDSLFVQQLSMKAHNTVEIAQFFKTDISHMIKARAHLSLQNRLFINPVSDDIINGYYLLEDVHKNPALIISTTSKRIIFKEWKNLNTIFIILIISTGSLAIISILLFLNKLVLRRLLKLTNSVQMISDKKMDVDFYVSGNDELSNLAENIRLMVQRLNISQNKLRTSNEKLSSITKEYKTIFNQDKDILFLIEVLENSLLRFKRVNPAFENILGLKNEELKGQIVTEIMREKFGKFDDRYLKECIEKNETVSYLGSFSIEGEKRFFNTVLVPFAERSKVIMIIGSSRDMTDIYKAQEEKLEAETKFRSLIEQSLVGISIIQDRKFIYVNPKFVEIFGYSVPEMLSMNSILDVVSEEDHGLVADSLKMRETSQVESVTYTFHGKKKDNSIIVLRASGKTITINDRIAVIGTLLDITEQTKSFIALRESEEKYRTIFENTGNGTIIIEEDTTISLVNTEMSKLLGHSKSELLGKPWTNFVHKDDIDRMIVYHKNRRDEHSAALRQYECRLVDKSGNVKNIILTVAIIPGTRKSLASCLDLTELKKIEESLMRSEERYRRMADSIRDGLTIVENEKIIYVNDRVCEIYGITRSDALNIDNYNLVNPDEIEKLKQLSSKHPETNILNTELEFWINRKDGTKRYLHSKYSFKKNENDKNTIFIVTSDNTERKLLEERLRKSEALESLGNLAGGIAHDLNNKLGPLVGYPDLLLNKVKKLIKKFPAQQDEFDFFTKGISLMKKAAEESAEEVQDLLSLARRVSYTFVPLNLNDVIKSLIDSTIFINKKETLSNIKITESLDNNLLNIRGSEIHLNKVFMNLIVNSFDAMPHGGVLKISTQNEYVDSPFHSYDDIIKIGEYASITIEDTGTGIKHENLKKIFEPFFSKKMMTKSSGSGLGLAIVYGIVKDHNGHIILESEYGFGTKFKILFPTTRETISEKIDEEILPEGNENILIVDDDEGQRDIGRQLLSNLGYNIECVSDGHQAIKYICENESDLIILDMIMEEGFDGLDTWLKIKEIKPQQKAIIVSGFSETDRVKTALESGIIDFIKKPYSLEKIAVSVRKALDKKNK